MLKSTSPLKLRQEEVEEEEEGGGGSRGPSMSACNFNRFGVFVISGELFHHQITVADETPFCSLLGNFLPILPFRKGKCFALEIIPHPPMSPLHVKSAQPSINKSM